tara:strand:- start:508 stop:696 length:189 start_codon:yes stop_codon:yes gene_type:complete
MSYSVLGKTSTNQNLYISDDNKRTCIGIDSIFQDWLRDNKDSLPDDIQAKVDAGTLTIADAD